MNVDSQRHKLLGILTKQRKNLELKKAEYNALGVPFDRIYKELDCNEDELHSITSDLYTSDEIGYHDAYNIIGIFAKENGVTAFVNKKYYYRVLDRRKERIKFFVQTVIPILALLVAILSLTAKFENLKIQSDREIEKLENKLIKQKKQIDSIETVLRIYSIQNKNIDSLNSKISRSK